MKTATVTGENIQTFQVIYTSVRELYTYRAMLYKTHVIGVEIIFLGFAGAI